MALRPVLIKIFEQNARQVRPILNKSNSVIIRAQATKSSTNATEQPSMFSPKTLKKNYEILPLIIIVGAGVAGLIFWSIRAFFTRDDLRLKSSGKMLCESTEVDTEHPENNIRKFRVYNQTYEPSPDLVKALEALRGPEADEKTK